jgi:hypothetical protein
MPTGIVNASTLNLRDGPHGAIIDTLSRDATVSIVGQQGQWLEVQSGAKHGFVSTQFVRVDGGPPPAAVPPAAAPGEVHLDGTAAIGPGGVRFGRQFKLGIFNYGTTPIAEFLRGHAAANAAPSLVAVMQAVSANEGKLEAINTWDDCFMTFGIFQWTAGADTESGELGAMLSRLKASAPAAFTEYFGRYGLDATPLPAAGGAVPRGVLSLDGSPLRTAAAKGGLRSLDWAYRFWRAGHDDDVRAGQIDHAMQRLECFYRVPSSALHGRRVCDYATSEYGVALLLDEHVNRPAHVPGTLGGALDELATHVDVRHPDDWSDAEEQELLALYLEHRATTSITDGAARAEAVRAAMTRGTISGRRDSFKP